MEFSNYSLEILGFLFAVSALAGFLDTLAGGGGLLSLPALLLSGMPPILALGTNKLQGSFGTGVATFMLLKKNKFSWMGIRFIVLASFIGSAIGAIFVQFVDAESLAFITPIVLAFIALYFASSPDIKKDKSIGSGRLYRFFAVPLIGAYDGMFGPGTGSFFVVAGVVLKRLELVKSTIIAKPLNFASNVASLIVFLSLGKVVLLVGLLMMAGQVIGASIGANYLVKANPKIIRLLVVFMSTSMLLRYSYSMGWFS